MNNKEHSLGEFTVHSQIKRMPAHSRLVFYRGKIHSIEFEDLLLNNYKKISIEEAIEEYTSLTAAYCATDNKTLVSLSAGIDSRLAFGQNQNAFIPCYFALHKHSCSKLKKFIDIV